MKASKMDWLWLTQLFCMALLAVAWVVPSAFGQVVDNPPVPISDIFQDIAELVKNFKGMKGIGVAAAIVALLVKLLNSEIFGNIFSKFSPILKRALITVLGQIAGVLMAISGGLSWVDAVVAGLLTSGGAVAIWEALKPFLKKKNNSTQI